MLHFNCCSVAVLFATAQFVCAQTEVELLSDPSFENEDSSWESVGNGYSRTTNEQSIGEYSAQLEGPAVDWSGVKQVVQMDGDTRALTISGRGMVNDELEEEINSNEDFALWVQLEYEDNSYDPYDYTLVASEIESWSWKSFVPVTIEPPRPIKTLTLQCGIRKVSGGVAWCDELSVKAKTPVAEDTAPVVPPTVEDCRCNRWGSWDACTVSCGGGVMSRERECLDSLSDDNDESGLCQTIETVSCNAEPCSAEDDNCYCSDWEAMAECTASCGGGMQAQERVCHADAALQELNAACLVMRQNPCNPQECPVAEETCECQVWSEFTVCEATQGECGMGSITRERACANQFIHNGTTPCAIVEELACQIPCKASEDDGATEVENTATAVENTDKAEGPKKAVIPDSFVSVDAASAGSEPQTSSTENGNKGSNAGVIAGVVVGLLLLFAVSGGGYAYYRYKQARDRKDADNMPHSSSYSTSQANTTMADNVSVSSAPLNQRVSEWRSRLARQPAAPAILSADADKKSNGPNRPPRYESAVTV
ncbi:hypothetical protein SARC_13363 [Sphaeroforma arctica JP610]|uniref:Spondin domain-containing protein n=1 Tax=Sphaeroforma arctica JP610 TaxID=667725 RepID=A0A0L0FBG2_9EUKA|nr:hypothetical protein SARC_13363 [Sphaeroforma arctica JP610]KNC74080.1 hypothetical protein SARC_13363 [Sphaeroforma arctica JP610]|eukprot:XP_014147982.1 hypothetical protein SARC_13363 [Sphaeroforma arctica JP610]